MSCKSNYSIVVLKEKKKKKKQQSLSRISLMVSLRTWCNNNEQWSECSGSNCKCEGEGILGAEKKRKLSESFGE
jgi:hypothetical protein